MVLSASNKNRAVYGKSPREIPGTFGYGLVILGMDLEVALGMGAGGADGGSLGANHDVTAVAAFPNLNFALFEYLLGFNIVK